MQLNHSISRELEEKLEARDQKVLMDLLGLRETRVLLAILDLPAKKAAEVDLVVLDRMDKMGFLANKEHKDRRERRVLEE